MNKSNIVLIGFMGSGKTTAGKLLHEKLGWPLVSTDRVIEEEQKRTIAQIFEAEGEARFRDLERAAIEKLSQSEKTIIDCGGGIVLNPENIKRLKQSGIIFYLKASADVIYKRIKSQKHRPLIKGDSPQAVIKELMDKRQALYEAAAGHTIDSNDDTMARPVEEILKIMKGKS